LAAEEVDTRRAALSDGCGRPPHGFTKLVLLGVLVALALPSTGQAGLGYLSMTQGKAALQDFFSQMVGELEEEEKADVYGKRLGDCVRRSPSAVECKWWYVAYSFEFDADYQCYGKMRASLRGNGTIRTGVTSSRCAAL
jgi:hypothetical protein